MLKASRNHVDEVGETYFEHLRAAMVISGLLAKAGTACTIPAIIPGLCTRAASRCIARLSYNLNRRGVAVQPERKCGVPRQMLSSY